MLNWSSTSITSFIFILAKVVLSQTACGVIIALKILLSYSSKAPTRSLDPTSLKYFND